MEFANQGITILKFQLAANGPVDLYLSTIAVTEIPSDRQAFADNYLYRASWIDDVPVLFKAQVIDDNTVEVTVLPADSRHLPRGPIVERAVRRKLSLDLDLGAFYQFVSTIPQLSEFATRQRGLRPIIKDSLLEALVLAVMDQQVNVSFAAQLKGRFLERYGRCYELDGIELRLFPAPEQMAQLEVAELKTIQLTGNRSGAIISLAQEYLAGKNWPDTTGTGDEIIPELCLLKGIGPWTAEYSALVGLGLLDTLPAADIALMRSIEKLYGLSARPTEKEVRELAQHWSPWKGLVTLYLWHRDEMEALGL